MKRSKAKELNKGRCDIEENHVKNVVTNKSIVIQSIKDYLKMVNDSNMTQDCFQLLCTLVHENLELVDSKIIFIDTLQNLENHLKSIDKIDSYQFIVFKNQLDKYDLYFIYKIKQCMFVIDFMKNESMNQGILQKFINEHLLNNQVKFISIVTSESSKLDVNLLTKIKTTLQCYRSNKENPDHQIREVNFVIESSKSKIECNCLLLGFYLKDQLNYFNSIKKDKKLQFETDLSKFFDEVVEILKCVQINEKYMTIRNEELAKYNLNNDYIINEDKIKNARQNLMNAKGIQDLKEKKYVATEKENYPLHEIQIKYKEEMDVLHICKDIYKLAKSKQETDTLEKICKDYLSVDITSFLAQNDHSKKEKSSIKFENFVMPEKKKNDVRFDFECNFTAKQENLTDIKSLEQILKELVIVDKSLPLDAYNNENKVNCIHYWEKHFKTIEKFYDIWKTSDAYAISRWSKEQKYKLQLENLDECIAIMDRANEIVTKGHRLRIPQIVSVLYFFVSKNEKNKICQIHTGEGKTTIISIIAAIKVMLGDNYVDIVTSNPVLAEEAVTTRTNFFQIFGISVSTNNISSGQICSERPCYNSNVVYGTIGSFQFDYLRHTFEGLNTRGTRQFGCLILDEVDCMMIDNANHIAKLSTPFPGFEYLKYVYIKIWQQLYKADEEISNKIYKNQCPKEKKNAKMFINDEDALIEQSSFSYEEIVRKIKDSKPLNNVLIPGHLKTYAEKTLDKWIENAINAFYFCTENEQYVLRVVNGQKEVIPVDYSNTGVTLKNTVWSYGLHQFIQLKHNLKVTPESLTSSCISNHGYIKLYHNNVLGVTGTLGSKAEQDFFTKVYDVINAQIPTFKDKKFKELPTIVVSNDEDWLHEILEEALKIVSENRAMLIICKTINDALELQATFDIILNDPFFMKFTVKKYTEECENNVTDEVLNCKDIVIATNIAGRGTDFKTSVELEKKGGLHVCTAFCPNNSRVKYQAFYRTARQGNSGSARLIFRSSDLLHFGIEIDENFNSDIISEKIDENEFNRLNALVEFQLDELQYQDWLFKRFSNIYIEIKNKSHTSFHLMSCLHDLKEFWAHWFENQDFSNKKFTNQECEKMFDEFERQASPIINGQVSHNPYYLIQEAEEYLEMQEVEKAEKSIDKAIELTDTPFILFGAYMKKFEITIEKEHYMLNRFKKALSKVLFFGYATNDEDNVAVRKNAISYLQKAIDSIKIEIDYMTKHILNENAESEEQKLFRNIIKPYDKNGEKNVFLQHLNSRLISLKLYHGSTEALLEEIKKYDFSCGQAIQSRIVDYLKNMEANSDDEKNMKEAMMDSELKELSLCGIGTTYGIRKVHDVSTAVVASAQGQVVAGLGLLATGVAFPPAYFALFPIASTLISEGIMDIVFDLLEQGQNEFNCKTYILGKVTSYLISFITMGISALVTCEKILNKAISLCKKLADWIKKAKWMKSLCFKLANYVDRFRKYLKGIRFANFYNKSNYIRNAKNLSYMKRMKAASFIVGTGVVKQVVTTVVMHKVGNLVIENSIKILTSELQPYIKEELKKKLNMNLLKDASMKHVLEKTNELLYGKNDNDFLNVLQNVSLGVAKSLVTNPYLSILVETIQNLVPFLTCIVTFASKLNEELEKNLYDIEKNPDDKEKKSNENDSSDNKKIDEILEEVSKMFAKKLLSYVQNVAQAVAQIGVSKMVSKGVDKFTAPITPICPSQMYTEKPHEVLGVELNATDEEILKAYHKKKLELMKNGDYDESKTKLLFESMKFLRESETMTYTTQFTMMLNELNPERQEELKQELISKGMYSNNNNCAIDQLGEMLNIEPQMISNCTGFINIGLGTSQNDVTAMMDILGIKSVRGRIDCTSKDKQFHKFFDANNANEAMLFIKNKDTCIGHVVRVKRINGEIIISDKNRHQDVTWAEYKKVNSDLFENLTIMTGKDLNLHVKSLHERIECLKNKPKAITVTGQHHKNRQFGYDEENVQIKDYHIGSSLTIKLGDENMMNSLNKAVVCCKTMQQEAENSNIKVVGVNSVDGVNNANTYDIETNSRVNTQVRRNNGFACYLTGKVNNGDRGRMIGVFHVTFKNGVEKKIICTSGDQIVNIRLNGKFKNDKFVETAPPTPFNFKTSDGYVYCNTGSPEGQPVINIITGEDTGEKFSRSCAFQKALHEIGKYMLQAETTVKNFHMIESMISYTKKNVSNYPHNKAACSCDNCIRIMNKCNP